MAGELRLLCCRKLFSLIAAVSAEESGEGNFELAIKAYRAAAEAFSQPASKDLARTR
jgi:hypothetical protein